MKTPRAKEWAGPELPPTLEPEEPLAPPDGKWYAVQRREGLWFVERTYITDEGAPAYQQFGYLARGLFHFIFEDCVVPHFSEENANSLANAFNNVGLDEVEPA